MIGQHKAMQLLAEHLHPNTRKASDGNDLLALIKAVYFTTLRESAGVAPQTLVDAAEDVCKTLEHPTDSVNAMQMWRLRDALVRVGTLKGYGDEATAWNKLFDQLALALKCLPSAFPEDNMHVIKKAQDLMESEQPDDTPVGRVMAVSVSGTPMQDNRGVEWLQPVPAGANLYITPQTPIGIKETICPRCKPLPFSPMATELYELRKDNKYLEGRVTELQKKLATLDAEYSISVSTGTLLANEVTELRNRSAELDNRLSKELAFGLVTKAHLDKVEVFEAKYTWLLHNQGLVEAHAKTWNPASHKPLMQYLQDFIDARYNAHWV